MERLTDHKTAEALRNNAEGLSAKGIDVPIDDLRYIKLARYEDEEERKALKEERKNQKREKKRG